MTISKELFLGKELSDGTYPVVIRITHKGKVRRISTSVRCLKKDWNSNRSCIAYTDTDFKIKNQIVESLFRNISGGIQRIIDQYIEDYLDSMLSSLKKYLNQTDGENEKNPESISFLDLIGMKIESAVSLNTRRGYEGFGRYFKTNFDKGPECGKIDQAFANRFLELVDRNYSGKNAMKNLVIARFRTVVNYGKKTGLINPGISINLPKCKFTTKDRNLNTEEVYSIFLAYKKAYSVDTSFEKPQTLALALFILDIAFQGLAPVDLAMLKVNFLNYKTLCSIEKNPKKYISDPTYKEEYDSKVERIQSVIINTTRKKTGQPVNIVSALAPISNIISVFTRDKRKDDYLIPCLDNSKSYTQTQLQNKLANFFNKMARHLNIALDEYYKDNDLGERKRISYYYARHAFCNCVDSLDVPRNLIQNMVGHKHSVLERSYLRRASQWEQAKISQDLFSLFI